MLQNVEKNIDIYRIYNIFYNIYIYIILIEYNLSQMLSHISLKILLSLHHNILHFSILTFNTQNNTFILKKIR